MMQVFILQRFREIAEIEELIREPPSIGECQFKRGGERCHSGQDGIIRATLATSLDIATTIVNRNHSPSIRLVAAVHFSSLSQGE